MRRPATIALLLLAIGPGASARASGINTYNRVIDLGQQTHIFQTEHPLVDDAGNILTTKTPGIYQVNYLSDPTQLGHILGVTLTKGDDPTNLLPAFLRTPSDSLSYPNASGHLVGMLYADGHKPFYFDPGTQQITFLKSLPGAEQFPQVYAINKFDQIVGEQDGKGIFYASPTSDPVELSALLPKATGWDFFMPTDINDRGEIVGYGGNPSGQATDFKLVPTIVPEPTTMAMFGLAGLMIAARKAASQNRFTVSNRKLFPLNSC